MSESLLSQLSNLRRLFSETAPEDPKVISDYGWTIVKTLNQHIDEVDSVMARQLLADCLKLQIVRPSKLYSAILSAALKVASTYPEFRFATFLKMWGIEHLRPEDNERQKIQDGKSFPSLTERTVRTLANHLLLHPEERPSIDYATLLAAHRLSLHSMLVTRIKEATGKDGRKYHFVTLTSPEGLEVECISNALTPHPLHPQPEGKRHYVNIGQLYDCLLKSKASIPGESSSSLSSSLSFSLTKAYLSSQKPASIFPLEIGYIDSIDLNHGQMHIYDRFSRHFVAHIQRFSKEKAGDFVRFIPIIPQESKFKTAIILTTVPPASPEVQTILREIRITSINKEKGYASWTLTDESHPITELLSPLQLSQGEQSPSFTNGYLNLTTIPDAFPSGLSIGQTLQAVVYLRRGKDKLKRPYIARILI